jgi:hypothetical protein
MKTKIFFVALYASYKSILVRLLYWIQGTLLQWMIKLEQVETGDGDRYSRRGDRDAGHNR